MPLDSWTSDRLLVVDLLLPAFEAVGEAFGKFLVEVEKYSGLELPPSKYAELLKQAIIAAHRRAFPKEVPFQHVHFEYASLARWVSAENAAAPANVREYFAVNENANITMEKFANEVKTYEPQYEILPEIDQCHYLSLVFFPFPRNDDEINKCISQGIYPIFKDGISCLADILLDQDVALFPWKLGSQEMNLHFEKFMSSQQEIQDKWARYLTTRAPSPWRIPTSRGVFEYALKSAITTLQIVSNELFDGHADLEHFTSTKQKDDWDTGKKAGRLDQDQLNKLRNDLLQELGGGRQALPQRALMFIPIRLPLPSIQEETVGLSAFLSRDPIPEKTAKEFAIIQRLLFLTCRQYELISLDKRHRDELASLEIQRYFARLLAHQAARPWEKLKEILQLAIEIEKDSGVALGRFARGEFDKLENPQKVDLYETVMRVREMCSPLIERRHSQFDAVVKRNTIVCADPTALLLTVHILVDNAIRHGQGKVRVWAEKENIGSVCTLYVANNGPRMSQTLEDAVRVGRPPVALSKSEKLSKGLGVGLSLAFGLARVSKGWDLKYDYISKEAKGDLRHVLRLQLPAADRNKI